MSRFASWVPLACLLAACAAEPEAGPPLPLPPPAPTRAPAQRAAPQPRPPAPAVTEAMPAPDAQTVPARPAAPDPVWRVARDGVVGCADRMTLAVLNQAAEGTPRVLAEARAAGGCRTTFRVNEWVAEANEAEAVRLRMTNGGPLTLWFRRSEVIAP